MVVSIAVHRSTAVAGDGPSPQDHSHRAEAPWNDQWPRATPPRGAWSIDVLSARLCEVELGEAFGVGKEVDLGDFPILDRDGCDRERPAVEEADHPGRAVDERTPHGQVDSGPEQGLAGDGLRTSDVLR